MSDDANVLGFFALAARSHIKLNLLTLFQGLVAGGHNIGEMDENIVTLFARDKAEALLRVEKLHNACSHWNP